MCDSIPACEEINNDSTHDSYVLQGGNASYVESVQPLLQMLSIKRKALQLSTAMIGFRRILSKSVWLRRILSDMEPKKEGPTIIYCDNMSDIVQKFSFSRQGKAH